MDFIIDAIVEWLKGLLVDGIMGNLDGLFDNVNQSVGEIATQVGTTPADWNAGVFSMIRQISETAILPIAGVILTFVMTYELIQMLIERNNLHEVDTWMFFKWVFKTFVAVMILTNTFNIVLAVFDVSQHVIQQSAGIIQNGTEITPDVLDSLRTELEAMELGPLFGLWLQSFLIQLTMIALNIVIFVIVYRLFGILPVRKSELVIGRYVFVLAMGLLSLIISLIAQPLVLKVLGETVGVFDIVTAAIAGVFLFALYTVFQIPGYYKYGSIKGRVFMYIPVAGFLVTLLLLSKMPAIGNSIISVVESSPILLVFLAVFAIVVMYAVSIFLSIRVMKNKEM